MSMYRKLRVRINQRRDYVNALELINNWWSQPDTKTDRPDVDTLVMMTASRVIEMAVMA